MLELFNYDSLFNQALEKVKHLRSPHMKIEEHDLQWDIVEQQKLFDFLGYDIEGYLDYVKQSKRISIGCLYKVIVSLFKKYDYDIEPIILKDINEQPNMRFAFKDIRNNTLLFFKEIEESNFWKISGRESDEIQKLLSKCGMTKCKYIYLMLDYAYLQIINHNDDVSDPGRGYNCYSIQWFFKMYFGEDECKNFLNSMNKYTNEVKRCLGYIFIKPLESYELLDFRRIVEKEIMLHSYEMLLKKKINKNIKGKAEEFILEKTDFVELQQQYFNKKVFLVMLSNHDFAESFITSEWLYDSMKKAQAIDLTVIGMGYFKAIEQLMFELISFHKNEKRDIKEKKSKKQKEFNETNLEKKILDTSIGAMAYFYKENLELLRNKLSESAKEYIRETIFDYAELRNEFFHKDNIHEWEKIKEIRNATFNIMFLLLGGQKLNNLELLELGMPKGDIVSDYYRLCEYVNYHSGEIFFLDFGQKGETVVCACSDMKAEIEEKQYIKYSGVYFRKPGNGMEAILITEDNLPEKIYLGKLDIKQSTEIIFNPVKVKVVFENKKYVGPLLSEEYRRLG